MGLKKLYQKTQTRKATLKPICFIEAINFPRVFNLQTDLMLNRFKVKY